MGKKRYKVTEDFRDWSTEIANHGTASQVGPMVEELEVYTRQIGSLIEACETVLELHERSYDPIYREAMHDLRVALVHLH